jgi:hypothetical protein
MEAYSKSRTGDAITSLSSLKPAEALVVGLSDEKKLLGGFHSSEGDMESGDTSTETEVQLSKPGSRVQKISADFLEIGDRSSAKWFNTSEGWHSCIRTIAVRRELRDWRIQANQEVSRGSCIPGNNQPWASHRRENRCSGRPDHVGAFVTRESCQMSYVSTGLIMSSTWCGTV